ncbi:hypothetical protein M885DRAFT_587227 [Pelagophyceae sp. CCMP2097]|nr:hypothetical protein M885DRAFT_587227 [Pelagophyceae sp. CCMP2097]
MLAQEGAISWIPAFSREDAGVSDDGQDRVPAAPAPARPPPLTLQGALKSSQTAAHAAALSAEAAAVLARRRSQGDVVDRASASDKVSTSTVNDRASTSAFVDDRVSMSTVADRASASVYVDDQASTSSVADGEPDNGARAAYTVRVPPSTSQFGAFDAAAAVRAPQPSTQYGAFDSAAAVRVPTSPQYKAAARDVAARVPPPSAQYDAAALDDAAAGIVDEGDDDRDDEGFEASYDRTDVAIVRRPQRPTSAVPSRARDRGRGRPASASALPAEHATDRRSDAGPARPGGGAPRPRPHTAKPRTTQRDADWRPSDGGAAPRSAPPASIPNSFAEYLLKELKDAEESRDLALTSAIRQRLQVFAATAQSHSDKMRLLSQLRRQGRRDYGAAKSPRRPSTAGEKPKGTQEEQDLALTTTRVIAKVRKFYVELRAERGVLHKAQDGLKDEVLASELARDAAEKAAKSADKQRTEALEVLHSGTAAAQQATSDAAKAMAAAAAATTAAAQDSAKMRAELEQARTLLRAARSEAEDYKRLRDLALDECARRAAEDAKRNRELAEYGARLTSRTHGAETEAAHLRLQLEVATEKLKRLDTVDAQAKLLAMEVERLKHIKPRAKSPRRKSSSTKSSTKLLRPSSALPKRPTSAKKRTSFSSDENGRKVRS